MTPAHRGTAYWGPRDEHRTLVRPGCRRTGHKPQMEAMCLVAVLTEVPRPSALRPGTVAREEGPVKEPGSPPTPLPCPTHHWQP